MLKEKNIKIAIIGLGYVGLPLAIEFGKKYQTLGYDISKDRVLSLKKGIDITLEATTDEINSSKNLKFSSNADDLKSCNIYIVTVPTPIDQHNKPNLSPLKSASNMLGEYLKKDDIVVYESTVFPGATEEVCVPILEEKSGLKMNVDFSCGYSPERINPGDKDHRLIDILKVTSGSNLETAEFIDSLYSSIIKAGTYLAPNIKVAEAAKVIENTQRDLNIALMNELSIIFSKLDIDTFEVLKAAKTKWNFLPFSPGLVGGHCIGVDPYYLTFKAQSLGYDPHVILSGRRINDGMGKYVANKLIKQMLKTRMNITESKVLIMGLTFKENCPDIRNSKVFDIIQELHEFNINVEVYDPWVDVSDIPEDKNINLVDRLEKNTYAAIIIAVSHECFSELGLNEVRSFGTKNSLFYDLKDIFQTSNVDFKF